MPSVSMHQYRDVFVFMMLASQLACTHGAHEQSAHKPHWLIHRPDLEPGVTSDHHSVAYR